MREVVDLITGQISQLPDLPSTAETREQVLGRMDSAIEAYIQQQVRDLGGYVSVERLVSVYSNSPHPTWKSHALAVPSWVTAVWVKADSILQEVDNGRPIPTTDELVAELPKIAGFITPVA